MSPARGTAVLETVVLTVVLRVALAAVALGTGMGGR